MGEVRVPVAPAVLRWALHRGGLDESSLAEVHADAHAWLRGEKQPTLKQLEGVARKAHVPYGMLFLPVPPPPEGVPIPDMRTPASAGIGEPSPELLDVLRVCQLRQDWYRDHMLAIGAEPVALVGSASVNEDPEVVGRRLRAALHLDDLPSGGTPEKFRSALISALEHHGVLVMLSGYAGGNTRRALDPQEFRGFALTDDLAPVIFVNGAEAKTAQNFTLLHEAAHLLIGHSALSDARPTRDGPSEEVWCNRVAAAALVPLAIVDSYRERAARDAGEAVTALARACKVSRVVAALRMKAAGLLSQPAVDEMLVDLEAERGRTARPAQDGGDYYRNARYRLGVPFVNAVVASTREGATSYRDAFRLLGTHKRAVMDELAEKVALA